MESAPGSWRVRDLWALNNAFTRSADKVDIHACARTFSVPPPGPQPLPLMLPHLRSVARHAVVLRLLAALVALVAVSAGCAAGAVSSGDGWTRLFDGGTLSGWEGNSEYFRVEEGSIVGGTTAAPIPRNEFLCREEEYGDFEMELEFRLDEGVNSGVQIRSQRIPGSHETIGYQADLGAGYWGAIYDESRRNTVLAQPAAELLEAVLDPAGWNSYRIVAEGRRIQLFINGQRTVDYTEPDPAIAHAGRICLQIHSGPPGEVRFREIRIRRTR